MCSMSLTGQFLSTYVLMFHLMFGSCTPSCASTFVYKGGLRLHSRRSVYTEPLLAEFSVYALLMAGGCLQDTK